MGQPAQELDKDPIKQLRERRDLLASVLGILRFMEGLQEGLEAVQLLGEKVRGVPRFAQLFLGGLDQRLTEADTAKLRGYLTSLERLVKQDMTRILRIAQADRRSAGRAGDPAPDELPPEECKVVDDFRRRTLTVVSLRILLRKRGESIGATALPVPQKLLDETLAKLEQERCAHSERALGEALMLLKDIDVQLQNKKLGDSMRKYLENMRGGLQQNVDHLKAGKPISELPVPMETSEAKDVDWVAGKSKSPEGKPEAVADGEAEAGKAQAGGNGAKPATAPDEPQNEKKRGLLGRAWRYVTTGTEVGWKDTETDPPKASTRR